MDEVRRQIKDMEDKGIIKKAATEFINSLVVVKKKNGKIRICLDAREINKRMTSDHAGPPTLDEVFRRMGNKKYYTTLDVNQAFWQIPLEESDTATQPDSHPGDLKQKEKGKEASKHKGEQVKILGYSKEATNNEIKQEIVKTDIQIKKENENELTDESALSEL